MIGVVIGVICALYGLVCFLLAVFKWDWYSRYPRFYPLGKWGALQIDWYGWIYDVHGDKAVRKAVTVCAAVFVILGVWLAVAFVRQGL